MRNILHILYVVTHTDCAVIWICRQFSSLTFLLYQTGAVQSTAPALWAQIWLKNDREREIQRRSTAEERYGEVKVHRRVEQAIKVTLWSETCLLGALWVCWVVKVKELLIGWGCCRVYPAYPLCTPTVLWRWPGFEAPQWLERRDRWGSLWKEAQKESKVGGPDRVRESLQLAHTDCHAK